MTTANDDFFLYSFFIWNSSKRWFMFPFTLTSCHFSVNIHNSMKSERTNLSNIRKHSYYIAYAYIHTQRTNRLNLSKTTIRLFWFELIVIRNAMISFVHSIWKYLLEIFLRRIPMVRCKDNSPVFFYCFLLWIYRHRSSRNTQTQ